MIEATQLKKSFKNGDIITDVLKGIDIRVEEREFISIMGRSGAGKSTFLYLLSLLDEPTGGDIRIDGQDTDDMTADEKARFRLFNCGYVFQDYALLPELTAIENVALPLLMQGKTQIAAYESAEAALLRVGLDHRLDSTPNRLSGGEQQRVSIARAVVHQPKILFADEPTANLDSDSAKRVLKTLKELNEAGQTIIMVTHEEEYARLAGRILELDDGKVVSRQKGEGQIG